MLLAVKYQLMFEFLSEYRRNELEQKAIVVLFSNCHYFLLFALYQPYFLFGHLLIWHLSLLDNICEIVHKISLSLHQ